MIGWMVGGWMHGCEKEKGKREEGLMNRSFNE